MSEQLLVRHRGEIVGTLTDHMPDMWFLEGSFTPSDSPAAVEFVRAASSLDARNALEDPSAAIRAYLLDSPTDEGTTYVVMSLAAGQLFGRRVFERDAVAWAEANVPE